MKKVLSLTLVLMMVFSLALPSFAGKPPWAGKGNDKDSEVEYKNVLNKENLPPGLAKKDILPYGLRKDMDVSIEDLEALMLEVEAYLLTIDPDALDTDDDGDTLPTDTEDDPALENEEDEEADEEDEDLIDAVYKLLARIEYELTKEESNRFGHYFFLLEKKYEVLQKVYGENVKDYEALILEIKAGLEDVLEVKDQIDLTPEDEQAINDILDEIEALEDYTEVVYDDFKDRAEGYLELLEDLEEEITVEDVEALRAEIKAFAIDTTHDYGDDIGEFGLIEFMAVYDRYKDYVASDFDEDLEEYYKDLNQMFKAFKMSEVVAGDYLDDLVGYKTLLEAYTPEEMTDDQEIALQNLVDDIVLIIGDGEEITGEGKLTLGAFYDLEERFYDLAEAIDAANAMTLEEAKAALKALADEAYDLAYADYPADDYPDVDQGTLPSEKITLLMAYIEADKVLQDEDSTVEDLQSAYDDLLKAVNTFKVLINE